MKDGPESLLEYVLVDPESTKVVSYDVEATGIHHMVATLPTLGDRDINWTVDEQWSIGSTTDPETVSMIVADEGLSIETPSQ